MEQAISSIYLDEVMAFQYLREIKRLVPQTDTGEITFISDVETNNLRGIVHSEKFAINKIVSIMYLQKNYTVFPDTTRELQRIAKALFEDCVRKGYQSCGLSILKCIADGAIDIPSYMFPDKDRFLRKGVLEILESYGVRQILVPSHDLSKRVILAMRDARDLRYKIPFSDNELLNAFNNTKIGSRSNENKIEAHQLELETEI